jgi:hypothetical protein
MRVRVVSKVLMRMQMRFPTLMHMEMLMGAMADNSM